jgi:hypothetical protein
MSETLNASKRMFFELELYTSIKFGDECSADHKRSRLACGDLSRIEAAPTAKT